MTPEPEWVDLGLPSGLLWAKDNIGSAKPEGIGLYFSWGNTDGHATGSGYDFSQAVYDTTPAAAITDNLSLSQDAARSYLGAPWRMPTTAEFRELYDNCTSVWTTLNGVNGRLFTSNVNGNTLFFPADGYYDGTSLNGRGSGGYCWSSTYGSAADARYLYFNSSFVGPQSSRDRRFGFYVRAVASPSNLTRSLQSLSLHEHLTNDIHNEGLEIQPIEPIIDSVTE